MCGLFGFSDYGHSLSGGQLSDLIDALAMESAVRGTDATGVAYTSGGKIVIKKDAKSAYQMDFKIPKDTGAVVGHVRHATQGDCKLRYNNHPFYGRLKNGEMFALAHNGIIANDKTLRKEQKLPNTKIETDSFIAVQLLERGKNLSFKNIGSMAKEITGSFSFSVIDTKNNIYLIKGDSPLSIIHFTHLGIFVYASTEQILWRALASSSLLREVKAGLFEEVNIKQGQILKISASGELSWGEFECLSDYYSSGYYGWGDFDCFKRKGSGDMEKEYLEELKSIAGSFGYSPEEVDYLRECGYTFEEIEELLYCEEYVCR